MTVHTHLVLHPNLEEYKCLLLEVDLLAWQDLAQHEPLLPVAVQLPAERGLQKLTPHSLKVCIKHSSAVHPVVNAQRSCTCEAASLMARSLCAGVR